MRNDLKLLVYAAAGVGVFTLLKRYGVLNDVGRWLSDQVPEDYKRQAAHAYNEAKQRVGEASDYMKDQAGKVGGQMKDRAQQAVASGNDAMQNIVGKVEETVGSDGSTAAHKVGRGVMH
jgi:hypothetical protein